MGRGWPNSILDSAIVIAITSALAYALGDYQYNTIWHALNIPIGAYPDITMESVFETGGTTLLVAYAIAIIAYIILGGIYSTLISKSQFLAEYLGRRKTFGIFVSAVLFLILCFGLADKMAKASYRDVYDRLLPPEVVFRQEYSAMLPDSAIYFGTQGDYHVFILDAMKPSCSAYIIHKDAVLEIILSYKPKELGIK